MKNLNIIILNENLHLMESINQLKDFINDKQIGKIEDYSIGMTYKSFTKYVINIKSEEEQDAEIIEEIIELSVKENKSYLEFIKDNYTFNVYNLNF